MNTASAVDKPEDLLTSEQSLAILGNTSPTTISRHVKAGRLVPVMRAPGRRGAYFFRRSDVEALAASKQVA